MSQSDATELDYDGRLGEIPNIQMSIVEDGWVLVDARPGLYVEMNDTYTRITPLRSNQSNYVDILTLNVEFTNDRGFFAN